MLSRKLTPSPQLAGFEDAAEGVPRDHFSACHDPNSERFIADQRVNAAGHAGA
jgi:hypothetical protein